MKFVLIGDPISQKRHRDCNRFGKSFKYDPLAKIKKIKKAELISQLMKMQRSEDEKVRVEALNLIGSDFYHIEMKFYFGLNHSDSESLKNAKLWGFEMCTNNKDVDNLSKFYLDVFKDVLIRDDRYVIKDSNTKSYSSFPRTEIEIIGYKMDKNSIERKILEYLNPEQMKELLALCFEIGQCYEYDEKIDELTKNSLASFILSLAKVTSAYLPKIEKKFKNAKMNQGTLCQ